MNERQLTQTLQTIAEDAIPANTDLIPRLQTYTTIAGERPTTPRGTSRPRLYFLTSAVFMVALTLGILLAPVAANAADNVAAFFGLSFPAQSVAIGEPVCVRGNERQAPILGPVTNSAPVGANLPPDAVAAQQVSCPDGFELKVEAKK